MEEETPRPGILGLTGYLLGGLIIAVTYLFVGIGLGLNAVHDAVGSPLGEAFRDGTALTTALVALFVVAPLLVAGVAALMGRHGAHTGQPSAGAAALTTLVGVPLLWVNLAIAALVVAAVLGAQGLDGIFDHTVDVLLSSAVAVLFALGPLVGLAALIANRATTWSAETAAALGALPVRPAHASPVSLHHLEEEAWEEPEPEPEEHYPTHAMADLLHDHPIDCPRCGNTFTVSGERPLRIACPTCGKTGTIR